MTEQIDKGGSDGAILGRSGGKVGFLGATPVVAQAVALTTTTATTASNEAALTAIITAMQNLGLFS